MIIAIEILIWLIIILAFVGLYICDDWYIDFKHQTLVNIGLVLLAVVMLIIHMAIVFSL